MNPFIKFLTALQGDQPGTGDEDVDSQSRVDMQLHEPLPQETAPQDVNLAQRITLEGDPSINLAPKIRREFKPEKGLPSSQAEVDAIPSGQRTISFFTSRPVPVTAVAVITVLIGGQPRQVTATHKEAQLCRAGNVPHVRAFKIKDRTIPWYEWSKYDPYKHYWAMEERNWAGTATIIPCLMRVENCDPTLKGYFKGD
jgi:hypothetical protein